MLIHQATHISPSVKLKVLVNKDSNADCTIAVLEVIALGGGVPLRHHDGGREQRHHQVRGEAEGAEIQSCFHGYLYLYLGELRNHLTEDEADKHPPMISGKNIILICWRTSSVWLRTPLEGYWKRRGHHRQPVGSQYGPSWTSMFRWTYGTPEWKTIPVPGRPPLHRHRRAG